MEASVLHCRGSVHRPLTDEEITEKAVAQLQTIYPAGTADEILAQCWRIGERPLVAPFCKQLAADG